MRSTNLRNGPVDRRYLSDQDKADYNNSGAYGRRATALSRARGRRGQIAYQQNRPPATTGRTNVSIDTGRSGGTSVQQQRNREIGIARNSEYKVKSPSNKGDLYGPTD